MMKAAKGHPHDSDSKADAALVDRWIDPDSVARRIDAARLVDSAVPVWALIGYLDAVNGDKQQVAQDYDVSLEAVEAAIAFYR